MDFRIFTDSGSDLTPELIKELDVSVLELKTTLTKPDGTVIDVKKRHDEKYGTADDEPKVADGEC